MNSLEFLLKEEFNYKESKYKDICTIDMDNKTYSYTIGINRFPNHWKIINIGKLNKNILFRLIELLNKYKITICIETNEYVVITDENIRLSKLFSSENILCNFYNHNIEGTCYIQSTKIVEENKYKELLNDYGIIPKDNIYVKCLIESEIVTLIDINRI